MKFCPKCGTERTGRFCGGCGFAYDDMAEAPMPTPVVEQPIEPVAVEIFAQVEEPVSEPVEAQPEAAPAPQPNAGLIYGPGFSPSTHCANCGEPRQPNSSTCSLCGV